ncbi:MAG: Hsp70 family protein [Conexibacter sp.]
MTPPVIGIDLGTTYSVVSFTDDSGMSTVITDEDGARTIPSVVHFRQDGDIVVGRHAKEYAKVEPQRVARVFKRGMGRRTYLPNDEPFLVDGKTWTPEELSSIVLKKLAGMAERHFGEPARRAVVTVPHYFGDPERAATTSAGELAGLEVLQIVNEPTAAAIAHGIDTVAEPGTLLVFDLGGGTFDVTIMRYGDGGEMQVISSSGDRQLGGTDFDDAILERMIAVAQSERGVDLTSEPWMLADATGRAEEMKIELSTSRTSTRSLSVGGPSLLFELTREELEQLIAPQVELVEDAVMLAFDKIELEPTAIDRVLMVGGSSRIPLFQQLVERITGVAPQLTRNLDEDVARGAGMLGAKLGGTLDPRSELAQMPTPVDTASHALGLLVVDDGGRSYNTVVIPEGTPLPFTGTRDDFFAASDNQTELELVLNEGNDADLDLVRRIAASTGRFAEPVNKGHRLRCELSYSIDQRVGVEMYDGVSGQFLCKVDVDHDGLLSAQEKESARAFLKGAEVR